MGARRYSRSGRPRRPGLLRRPRLQLPPAARKGGAGVGRAAQPRAPGAQEKSVCGREAREVAAAQTKKSWARIDVRSYGSGVYASTGHAWPAPLPPTKAPTGSALTVRVLPLCALPVVHPTETLEVVIVAAPRPVHRHHGEVRHRARSAPPSRLPARLSQPPGAAAPRPLAFLPAALTSSARPRAAPRGRGAGGARAAPPQGGPRQSEAHPPPAPGGSATSGSTPCADPDSCVTLVEGPPSLSLRWDTCKMGKCAP